MTTVSCHGTTLPRPAYRHTGRAHQPPGFISADRTAVVLELFRHAAPAIAVARLVRNRFHVRDPGDLVTINRGGRATLQVSVESAVAHVKYLTEHGDWPRVLVLGPTGLFHRGSLTKKRMAFFKINTVQIRAEATFLAYFQMPNSESSHEGVASWDTNYASSQPKTSSVRR
jgi:hypothetical protein